MRLSVCVYMCMYVIHFADSTEVDGNTHVCHFENHVLCILEKETGRNCTEIDDRVGNSFHFLLELNSTLFDSTILYFTLLY